MRLRTRVLVTSIVLAMCACSKDLSRSRAVALIRNSYVTVEPVTVTLGTGEYPLTDVATCRSENPLVAQMEALGFVRLEPVHGGAFVSTLVSLTPAGQQESKTWAKEPRGNFVLMLRKYKGDGWRVPIAKRDVVEITGITKQELMGMVMTEAQFTWTAAPTKMGTALGQRETSGRGQAMFRLYDDGWRLEHISGV